jgi:hypothetical protein
MFENRALRRIFELKKMKPREGGELHNEEFHNFHSLANIIIMIESMGMRWAGHISQMGGRIMCRLLMGKPEGKRRLGRPKHRWMDNIKKDLCNSSLYLWCWKETIEDTGVPRDTILEHPGSTPTPAALETGVERVSQFVRRGEFR